MSNRAHDTLRDIITDLDGTIGRLSGEAAQGDPDLTSERKYFEAQRRAYVRAQYHAANGVEATAVDGAWLVPSNSRAALVHRITRQGEILVCDCEAAANGRRCWHAALAEATELALDRADAHDDPDPEPAAEPEPDPLPPAPALRLVPRPDLGADDEYANWLAFGRAA